MPLHWHAEGKPLKLNDDFEATITASGGYDQLTATADRDDVRHLHQGSGISAETSAGKEVWFGTLDATPALSRNPLAHITASGPVGKARKQRGNRLYQSRDYSLWKPLTSDPYNKTAIGALNLTHQSVSADSQQGRLVYSTSNGTDIKQNDANALAAWFMGEAVTRIAFDWTAKAANANYTMRVYTGSGPSGSLTQRGADITFGTSGSVDYTLAAGDDDLIAIVVYWSPADATTAVNWWTRIGNLRVNGRTMGDDYSPGQIIADLAHAVGWKTTGSVKSSGINGLPFYWPGGSWADAIAELATLDDWPWLVTRNRLDYDAWDTKWHLHFSPENEDLNFLPVHNSVRVFYTTLAGDARSVPLRAKPDPLAKYDIDDEFQYDLSNSYDSDVTPTAVAAALLERVTTQRVVGSINVTSIGIERKVWTPHRRFTVGNTEAPYHVLPGDLARLEPYPKLPPQRIVEVRLHSNDVQVVFGDDVESATVGKVLARIAGARDRRRVKLRKHA